MASVQRRVPQTALRRSAATPLSFYSYKADLNGDGFIDSDHTTPWGTLGYGIDTDSDGVPNETTLIPNETAGYSQLDVNVAGTSAALGAQLPMVYQSQLQQDAFIRTHMASDTYNCYGPCDLSSQTIGQCIERWFEEPVPPDIQKCMQKASQYAGIATGMKLLDANGDGLKDILTWNVGPSASLTLWINTGRNQFTVSYMGGLLSQPDQQTLDSFLNAGSFKQSFVYDVNKDGLEHLVIVDPTSRKIYALVMGPDQGTGAKFNLQWLASAGVVPDWFSATSQVMVLDVDSDGAADIVFGDGKQVAVAYQGGADHDLLATVTDGNGRIDSVSYVAGAQDTDHYSSTLPQTNRVQFPIC